MRIDDSIDMNSLTDKEIEAFFAPRKANQLKSLLPLFVYLVLKEHSNAKRHLTQREIIAYLQEYPYEVSIERKALSRCIHLLTAMDLGIYSTPHRGTWMES